MPAADTDGRVISIAAPPRRWLRRNRTDDVDLLARREREKVAGYYPDLQHLLTHCGPKGSTLTVAEAPAPHGFGTGRESLVVQSDFPGATPTRLTFPSYVGGAGEMPAQGRFTVDRDLLERGLEAARREQNPGEEAAYQHARQVRLDIADPKKPARTVRYDPPQPNHGLSDSTMWGGRIAGRYIQVHPDLDGGWFVSSYGGKGDIRYGKRGLLGNALMDAGHAPDALSAVIIRDINADRTTFPAPPPLG